MDDEKPKNEIVRDERGHFKKGFSGHPSGRPKGSKNKSLNFWLEKAMNETIEVDLSDGSHVETTPAEILGKILARAMVTGNLQVQNRTIPLKTVDYTQLAQLLLKQLAPPVQKIDMMISESVEGMSDGELLQTYLDMMEEEGEDVKDYRFEGFEDAEDEDASGD